MAKKDSLDKATGNKLRRLDREQCETADAIFEQLQSERDERERKDDNVADEARVNKHAGPVGLASLGDLLDAYRDSVKRGEVE